MAVIAQAELVGQPFKRIFHLDQGRQTGSFPQWRRVRVGALLDDETGDMGFRPARKLPKSIDWLHHLPLKGHIFDSMRQRPSLSTARKEGASIPYVDVYAALIARGATLKSPLKTDGFALAQTRKAIAEERKRKRVEEAHGQEAAAVLFNHHTSPPKKGGFAFANSWREVAQERKRQKLLAAQARAQMGNQYLEFT